ncbi:MAG: hypothetical protein P4L67_00330 [Candidatus Pacebacteria bacterium]|nr:hypothetical protein [Candidatus Paceibacterota bacterium]
MKKLLWICVAAISASPLFAQQRNFQMQLFVSDGISVNRASGAKSDALTANFAIVAPRKTKFFVKSFIGTGRSFAINPAKPTPSVPVFQVGALVGYHATKRFSPLAGYIEAMQFPATSGNLYLPTFIVTTATRIHGHWGIYTPFTVNEKSYCGSAQLGYTW